MDESDQIHGREFEPDETSDAIEEGGILDVPLRRSDFLTGAGRLGIGALGLGALAGFAPAAFGAAGSSREKQKVIAMIENQSGPFYTDNFEKPMRAYLADNAPTWKATFGNENNSLPTGVQLFNQYGAAGDAAMILLSAQPITGYVQAAKQYISGGGVLVNHSTSALGPANQNVLFSHKQAGIGIGTSAVNWAKKNNITQPVVALIGLLTDAQPKKRTTWAWNTIKAAFPNAQLVGEVQGIDQPSGAKGAANLLAAHPNINIMIVFDGPAGVGALTSANQAGKTDPKSFYLGVTDQSTQSLGIVAKGNTVMQANWGVYFPASAILCTRDLLTAVVGHKIKPTRLLLGESLDTPAKASAFTTIAFNPTDPKYKFVFTKYNKYLDTPVDTGQVPPGQ